MMNLPNKLTLMRVMLIPIFLLALYVLDDSINHYVGAGIFIAASLTDFFDGAIARSRGLVTDFGKFMDPLADKLLVASALIYFVEVGVLPAYVTIIILSREFAITGFRVIAANKGIVLAAGWWGKVKTALTMVMIIVLLFELPFTFMNVVNTVLIIATTLITVISGIDYVKSNPNVIDMSDL